MEKDNFELLVVVAIAVVAVGEGAAIDGLAKVVPDGLG
jgi:hypothetical protein